MKRASARILALMLVMLMVMSGAASASEGPMVFSFAYAYDDMYSLDVHKHTTTDVIQTAMTMGEPLLQYDSEGNVYPLLLEDLPAMSEDGTLFTCKLKEGVMFHDGTELTTADVEFTFNRIFDPLTQNLNTWLCDMIKGGTAMLNGEATTLEGLKVIDDYTFTLELDRPYAPFLGVLACEQMMIYPKAACEAAGDQWGVTTFVGTGPFELVEFVSLESLHVKRFEGYHGAATTLDELYIYNMDQSTAIMEFEAGNLDMVRVDPDLVEPYKDSEYKLERVDLMGIIAMNMNVNMPPLDDVKVRQAISYAIDQNAMVESFLQGNGNATNSLIPPAIMGHSDRPSRYDPEKAKALLAEAGYPDGITLVNYVADASDISFVPVVLQEQFKAAGITLEVNRIDQGTYVEMRRAGEVQIPILTWYKDISDPDNFTYTFYHSSASQLFSSNWNDPKTDEMLTEGRASSGDTRTALYQELETYLVEEQAIVVPLYNPVFYYLMGDTVEGIMFDNSLIRFAQATK